MTVQKSFAHWWSLNAWRFDDFPGNCEGDVCAAFLAGCKVGLKEAAEIAEPCGQGAMMSNVGPVVAAAIRQRIEETK